MSKKKQLQIMGLALALPSAILGIFGIVYKLKAEGIIGDSASIAIILTFIGQFFYLIIRYALKKN